LDRRENTVTVLRSALLEREGFGHGFGTRRTAPEEFPSDIHILLQVHGERIVILTENSESRIQNSEEGQITHQRLPDEPFRFDEGDAMVSNIPGVSMGIRTADCLPLLIADRVKGTAAAVHCGWRSLALGLAGKAVRVMTGIMESKAGDLLAAIGPSIGPCCYEVGEEVKEAFSHFRSSDGLFVERDKSQYLDLASGVKTQLIMEGMTPETIDEIVGCTSCNPELFWSWRARKEEGRMVSFITVREAYAK
jgi:YfiH family protein